MAVSFNEENISSKKTHKELYDTLPINIINEIRDSITSSMTELSKGFSRITKLLVAMNKYNNDEIQVFKDRRSYLKISLWKRTMNNLSIKVKSHFESLIRILYDTFPDVIQSENFRSNISSSADLDKIIPTLDRPMEAMLKLIDNSNNCVLFTLKQKHFEDFKGIKLRDDGGGFHHVSSSEPNQNKPKREKEEKKKVTIEPKKKNKIKDEFEWKIENIDLNIENETSNNFF